MRKRSSLWLVGFVLLGVLALSVMVILLGGREASVQSNEAQAERAWSRLMVLFENALA